MRGQPLDYCKVLYMGLSLKTVWKLSLVQKAAARVLTGVKLEGPYNSNLFLSIVDPILLSGPVQGAGIDFMARASIR